MNFAADEVGAGRWDDLFRELGGEVFPGLVKLDEILFKGVVFGF